MLFRLFLIIVLLATSFVSLCAASAQELPAQIRAIENYLDGKTTLVAWIDPQSIAVDKMRQLQSLLSHRQRPSEVDEFLSAMKKGQINALYMLSESEIHSSTSLVVFAASKNPKATAQAVREYLPPGMVTSVQEHGVLIAFDKDMISQLESRDGALSAQLRSSLMASDFPAGCVLQMNKNSQFVEALESIFQGRPEGVNFLEGLRNVKGMRVFGRIPTTLNVEFDLDSASDANALADATKQLLESQRHEEASQPTVASHGRIVSFQIAEIQQIKLLRDAVLGNVIRDLDAMNQMRQIVLAFHNFHDVHGSFPPQAIASKDGNKLLSWRVAILPYLAESALYEQFHLDEPWDSPHNRQLIPKMPNVYRSAVAAEENRSDGKSQYVVPLTENSLFGRVGKPMRFANVTDGLSFTIALLEAKREQAVIWTQPEDIIIQPGDDLKKFAEEESNFVIVGFGDGAVRKIRKTIAPKTFQALVGATDGQPIDPAELDR